MMAQKEILEDVEKEAQIQPKEELEEVNLRANPGPPRPVFISNQLSVKDNEQLVGLLKRYVEVFVWTYDEMSGLDPRLVVHSLNVNLRTKPVIQPTRVFHTEIEAQITQEVKKLLAAGFIKPIQHPKWLSNIVSVKKKNGQI